MRGELYDMCFFLVPLEKELESVILGIECALALQEIVHPADQAWHFAAREHIRGGLYRSPDFGGGTEMAMVRQGGMGRSTCLPVSRNALTLRPKSTVHLRPHSR